VADGRLDLPFAIRMTDATGKRRDAVVREHVTVERIRRRIVDVGLEDAFLEIVEHREARSAAEATEGALVELGPRATARLPN